jgi:hypothetical protein
MLIVIKSGSLTILDHSESALACTRIALPLPLSPVVSQQGCFWFLINVVRNETLVSR